MINQGLVKGIMINKNDKLGFCQACVEGKKVRDKFPVGEIKSKEKLEMIHSDVCEPMQTTSFLRISITCYIYRRLFPICKEFEALKH